MLHNICGRAKSGKTEYLFSCLEKLILKKKHTFLIVPEQSALIVEREIIERFGNRSNEYVEVINFKRLCNRVYRETGGLIDNYVDTPHKLLVMARAAEACSDLLLEYHSCAADLSFIKKALSAITEFKMYGVTPLLLEKSAEKLEGGTNALLCAKLKDMSLLYAQYSSMLSDVFSYTDSTDDMVHLRDVLDSSHFFKDKTVLIDSFFGFTVPEINIIENIIHDADDLYITYLYDKNTDSAFFERGRRAYMKITSYAEAENIAYDEKFLCECHGYESSSLSNLERNFAQQSSSTIDEVSDKSIRIISCDNPYDESNICAAAINSLVLSGAKYSEIAVCARNIEDYFGILDTELKKENIPFSFNIKYDLLTRPVIAFILSAFEFARSKSKQSVLRHIKTGLTKLSACEADLVECYIRTWNIQGRMFTDIEWLMNPNGYSSAEDMDDRTKEILSTLEDSRKKLITPLESFTEDVRSAKNANQISEAVMHLLANADYDTNLICGEDVAYHNMLIDALECIGDCMGNENISHRRYAELLEMILGEYETGRIPSTIDEVSVSSAELFRGTKTGYMIVLGLCDGVFPKTPGEDCVFSDRERFLLSEIGVELSGDRTERVFDELFLAYRVISSPSKKLFLTYNRHTASGEDASASTILSLVDSAVGNIQHEVSHNCYDLIFSLSDTALAREALKTENATLSSVIKEYLEKKKVDIPAADYSYSSNYLSGATAENIFGKNLYLSPSRLDKFNMCAFSYFGTYILGLRPEPVAVLGPGESGNIAHKILEILISELAEKKQNGEEITVEYATERSHELLRQYISTLVGEGASKNLSSRFKYLYGRLSFTLNACVTAMTSELIDSEFIPREFEMSIGTESSDVKFNSVPITDIDGNVTGSLTLVGKVDRTDIYEKNGKVYIRVVDYKTGTKKFNLADVNSGINLQMLLYLYSLTKDNGGKFGDGETVPAGVLYIPVHRPEIKTELGEFCDVDVESTIKSNGILIDDIEILSAMEKNLEGKYIPVKLKKDGGFYSGSSVASLETIGRLLTCACDVASKLAYEIQTGKIAKNPYRCKNGPNSCNFCDMAYFCRYKLGDEGTRYALTSYSDEVFEKTTGGDV